MDLSAGDPYEENPAFLPRCADDGSPADLSRAEYCVLPAGGGCGTLVVTAHHSVCGKSTTGADFSSALITERRSSLWTDPVFFG